MTTIINPAGTPTPVYNRSGKTLYSLSGGVGGGSPIGNNGTAITAYSEHTIVVCASVGSDFVFTLPSASSVDLGDMITVVNDPTSTTGPTIFPAIGDSILNLAASTGTNGAAGYGVNGILGATFIKVSSTNWQPF